VANWSRGIRRFSYIVNRIPLLFCLACSGGSVFKTTAPGSISAVVRAADHDLEVSATPEQQARQDVLNTPTVFNVSFADDPYSWERARFFLENYLGGDAGHASAVTRIVGERWSLASNPAIQQYSYEVSKDAGDSGFTYQVSCMPGVRGDPEQAALNAGNLARFIREGKLELSLLTVANERSP
jgi:hypothetical protein